MGHNRQEVLDLIEHPPLGEVYLQHRARVEGEDPKACFGDYRVQPMNVSPLEDPSIGPYRTERISPLELEATQNLGSLVIRGITEDQREAIIVVNRLSTPEESIGTVILL